MDYVFFFIIGSVSHWHRKTFKQKHIYYFLLNSLSQALVIDNQQYKSVCLSSLGDPRVKKFCPQKYFNAQMLQ